MRTKIRSQQRLPVGSVTITISTEYAEVKPGGPLNITLSVNDDALASGTVPVSAPLLFTANDCLDIGVCHGGRVSLDYYDRAPFPFNGTIKNVNVRYTS
jgi:arylsulfatase